jgi:hypothetical protein
LPLTQKRVIPVLEEAPMPGSVSKFHINFYAAWYRLAHQPGTPTGSQNRDRPPDGMRRKLCLFME